MENRPIKTRDEYWYMYAPQADPRGLLNLGRQTIIAQIIDLNPDEPDPQAAADAIIELAAVKVAASAGGSAKTQRKSSTSAANGKKGGRPKKQP